MSFIIFLVARRNKIEKVCKCFQAAENLLTCPSLYVKMNIPMRFHSTVSKKTERTLAGRVLQVSGKIVLFPRRMNAR